MRAKAIAAQASPIERSVTRSRTTSCRIPTYLEDGKSIRWDPVIDVNGRRYALPRNPVVVVCVDGCEPDYLDRAVEDGAMPWLGAARAGGTSLVGDCVMPSFTNPNNLSIVTGAPPSLHGISGNFALDRDSGAEIMMTDPAMVHGETILALMSRAGVPTAAITAKDKLRRMLGRGLDIGPQGICFSSEQANRCTFAE